MKISFLPIAGLGRYLYYGSVPLLLLCWLDQWLELYLLPDLLRAQLFIISIIMIAIAAIINLSAVLLSMHSATEDQHNKNNQPDDH